MISFVELFGIHFFETTFCVSFLFLLYVTSCQSVVQSCLLFSALVVSYRVIRNKGASILPSGGKNVLITGCDTGFGNALARLLDQRGMIVFASCLSEDSDGAKYLKKTGSKHLTILQMDVASDESVTSCLRKVTAACHGKGLWAIVNNAGISYNGDCEMQPMSMYKKIADVNLFGIVRVCKAFLPLIRITRGRVVNVTSVQGLHAYCRMSAYGMSKFAAEGFTDCLRLEMRRFGVKVVLIEPGRYGLVTAQFTEEAVNRMEKVYKETLDSLSEEIRYAYGEEYLNLYLTTSRRQKPGVTDEDLRDVLNAFEDAILSTRPHIRYLVDGYETWIDDACIMARLNHILPAFLMDRIYLWRRPMPKEIFGKTQKSR